MRGCKGSCWLTCAWNDKFGLQFDDPQQAASHVLQQEPSTQRLEQQHPCRCTSAGTHPTQPAAPVRPRTSRQASAAAHQQAPIQPLTSAPNQLPAAHQQAGVGHGIHLQELDVRKALGVAHLVCREVGQWSDQRVECRCYWSWMYAKPFGLPILSAAGQIPGANAGEPRANTAAKRWHRRASSLAAAVVHCSCAFVCLARRQPCLYTQQRHVAPSACHL